MYVYVSPSALPCAPPDGGGCSSDQREKKKAFSGSLSRKEVGYHHKMLLLCLGIAQKHSDLVTSTTVALETAPSVLSVRSWGAIVGADGVPMGFIIVSDFCVCLQISTIKAKWGGGAHAWLSNC